MDALQSLLVSSSIEIRYQNIYRSSLLKIFASLARSKWEYLPQVPQTIQKLHSNIGQLASTETNTHVQ